MGASSCNKESNLKQEPQQQNKSLEIIKLLIEICASWGAEEKQIAIQQFVEYVKKKGFSIKENTLMIEKGRGEFYIFLDKENKIPVFSNNIEKHPSAVISFDLTSDLFEAVLEKIKDNM